MYNMRGVTSLLLCCLLGSVAAQGFGSLFGKRIQAVGSNTVEAAKSVGQGLETVGKPIGQGLETVGKPVGQGLETVGKPIGSAAKSIGSASGTVVKTAGQGVQKEIQTVKQPIDETIAFVGTSQCKNVQKLFGVSYEQLQGEREPDLKGLEIVFQTKAFKSIINITQPQALVRQARSFEPDDRVVLFLHGFTDDPSQDGFTAVSQAYLSQGRSSVLALDASSLIRWFYVRSAIFVRFIGDALGTVLAELYKLGQDPDKMHVVGHSLGSHIGAFACKTFERLTGRKLGRMTGLDPAGPCFSNLPAELRLKRSDASYVDVVHTDAGVYGLREACGHKDYFPNGGSEQPNCLLQTCSHSRAVRLYAESVLRPAAFPAVRCRDWAAFKKGDCERDNISYMGYPSKPGNNGLYFLQTNGDSPYGLEDNGTRFTNKDGVVKNIAGIVG